MSSLVSLSPANADPHVLFLADMYWDWDEETGCGAATLEELAEAGATMDPITGMWTAPSP